MPSAPPEAPDAPVLIYAPFGRDGDVAAAALQDAALPARSCAGAGRLADALADEQAAALVLTEEGLPEAALVVRSATLRAPAWSELPVLLLTRAELRPEALGPLVDALGERVDVLPLARPVQPSALVAFARMAQKARKRQYQVAGLLQALSESGARYRQALAAADLGTWEFDAASGLTHFDARAQDIFGLAEGSMPAERMIAYVHPADRDAFAAARDAALDAESQTPFTLTHRIVRPTGEVRWVRGYARVSFSERAGERVPARAVGVVADVTERVQAEQTLRHSETHLRRVIDNQLGFVAVLDQRGALLEVNQAALNVAGLARADVVGQWFWECPWWNYDPEIARRIQRAVEGAADGHTVRFDVPARVRGGHEVWIDFQITPALDAEGDLVYLVPSGVDVSERREAEQALRRLNASLEQRVQERTWQVRKLSRALTLAEQEERRRIAYVLHEDLQQVIAGARTIGSLGDTDTLLAMLDEALSITRSLSHELAPPLIDEDENLRSFLEWVVSKASEWHGLDVSLDVRGRVVVVEPALRALLYQLVRELLFNVTKHAGTHRARVIAERDGPLIHLSVEDAGHGFDAATISPEAGGLGLTRMRERVELVGGEFSLRTAPGEGTRVTISVPADSAAHAPSTPTL
jgi:PAS domain S-box-containing protein